MIARPADDSNAPPWMVAKTVISREATQDLSFGTVLEGTPQATAGDFDFDGNADLAIGLTSEVLTSSSGPGHRQQRARPGLRLLRHRRAFGPLSLSGADVVIDGDVFLAGEAEGNLFGTLPTTPGLDLNNDRIDDLLIGAAQADARDTGLQAHGRQALCDRGRGPPG